MMFNMPNEVTIVFQNTYPRQLRTVALELEQRFKEVEALWKQAEEQADSGDRVDYTEYERLNDLYNSLFNVLCDLEVDGYEVEEAPRYNRWLDT